MNEIIFHREDLYYHYDVPHIWNKSILESSVIARHFFDTTGLLPTKFKLKKKSLPNKDELDNFNMSFEESMISFARTTLNREQPIDIYWSGGIDSTSILVAFLIEATKEEKKRITVRFIERAIRKPKNFVSYLNRFDSPSSYSGPNPDLKFEEYPLFFEKFIKNDLNYEIFDEQFEPRRFKVKPVSDLDFRLNTHLCITGVGLGYGADTFGELYPKEINRSLINDYDKFEILNELEDILVKCCPYEIKTNLDYHSWFKVSQFGNGIDIFFEYIYKNNSILTKNEYKNIIEIPRDEMMILYNLKNRYKIKKNNEQFGNKYHQKRFIYNYTKDKDYFDNKDHVGSGNYNISNCPLIIDDELNIIRDINDKRIKNYLK